MTIFLVQCPALAKILSISEAEAQLRTLIDGVERREDDVIITRNGRPTAMIINYAEYERLRDRLDTLEDNKPAASKDPASGA